MIDSCGSENSANILKVMQLVLGVSLTCAAHFGLSGSYSLALYCLRRAASGIFMVSLPNGRTPSSIGKRHLPPAATFQPTKNQFAMGRAVQKLDLTPVPTSPISVFMRYSLSSGLSSWLGSTIDQAHRVCDTFRPMVRLEARTMSLLAVRHTDGHFQAMNLIRWIGST